MKKINCVVLIICMLLLYGCGGITDKGIREAYKVCETHEGINFIESIYIHTSDEAKVFCKDGTIITYRKK